MSVGSIVRRLNTFLARYHSLAKLAAHEILLIVALAVFRIRFMQGSSPLVSVVIPVYDRPDLLKISLESAINVKYLNREILVVCDGSPVEIKELLTRYKDVSGVRIIFLEGNSGTAVRARNEGIRRALGSYIAFLDSDDVMDPMRLNWSIPPMEVFGFGVTHGHWRAIVDGSRPVSVITNGQLVRSGFASRRGLLSSSILCQSTVTVKTDLFDKVGMLKTEMRYREDHELWLRLAYNGTAFFLVNRCLVKLRLHSRNNELNFISETDSWKSLALRSYLKNGPKRSDSDSSNSSYCENDSQT